MRFAVYCETGQTRLGFGLLALSAIKTNVGCVSTSSKCTYVLNGNSKSTARLLKWTDSLELFLLEHAMKTNINCASTSMKLFHSREIFYLSPDVYQMRLLK